MTLISGDPYKPDLSKEKYIFSLVSRELFIAIAFDEMLHVGPRLEEFFVAWDRNEYLVVIVA